MPRQQKKYPCGWHGPAVHRLTSLGIQKCIIQVLGPMWHRHTSSWAAVAFNSFENGSNRKDSRCLVPTSAKVATQLFNSFLLIIYATGATISFPPQTSVMPQPGGATNGGELNNPYIFVEFD